MASLYEDFHLLTRKQYKIISVNNFTYRNIIALVNKYLSSEFRTVLDIGCGAGTISLYIASKGYNVLGIDISQTAIDACRESKQQLGLKKVFFETYDFPSNYPKGKFDFIICSEVIEHINDDDKAFEIMSSKLKRGGILILTTPSKNAPLFRMGLLNTFERNVGHVRRYNLKEMLKKVKKYEFTVVEVGQTEGILRNYLFTNFWAGKIIRFIKFSISDFITFIDNLTIRFFGASNMYIVLRKK